MSIQPALAWDFWPMKAVTTIFLTLALTLIYRILCKKTVKKLFKIIANL